MKIKIVITAIYIIISAGVSAQIANFHITVPPNTGNLTIPVSMNLDQLSFASDSSFSLVEFKNGKEVAVPFQIKNGDHRSIFWLVDGTEGKKIFQLKRKPPLTKTLQVTADNTDGALTIHFGDMNLLQYQYKTVYPPPGIDTNFKKSGFIHPLWAPHGQELTRIQPSDHYHHYGIWNPWTHTLFENDTVDFWNLDDKKGTVRFAKLISQTNGPVYSEFETLHEHVAFKPGGKEKIALNELQTVRVYRPATNYYIIDFISQLSCASESPLLLLTYRYGGFGWRTTGYWDNKNSEVITSAKKTRKNADGSKAKWCIVQGALNNDYGGAVLLSYPSNYNHPEPLRIWPENQYDRGDMFVNFSPTKDKDWLLVPGKTYVLKYRLVVFNGKLDSEKAESAWNSYANTPEISTKEK